MIAHGPVPPVLVLRHGESTANVQGLIVSLPGPRALTEVGLTARGRAQAQQAAREGLARGLGPQTVVLTSDFARARETAEEFARGLGAAAPTVDVRLRERGFGAHDGGPADAYETVWAADRARELPGDEVESVDEVARRVFAVLRTADERAAGAAVVLVAHGDVLQIALALGAGRDPHEHREVPHLGNAELRELGPGRGSGADGAATGGSA
ncbi:histidine phosphatase family protein [Brachybacterium saurashtrense]|uniref:Histidine phosphatase family protein n=1 Tax=Brachybacterium saurashtrense TaxID=556288 RepID=A0A345YQC5_9MICO|nr:histidine phosphatase family protein [Brachybacterium saurashtrense]AXK46127.1 histidine phosphatase family protein [Brachybacterium saurashtrense]RRR23867.1 histidine phosphatase family protein [Brachybacterium saurashtrense]